MRLAEEKSLRTFLLRITILPEEGRRRTTVQQQERKNEPTSRPENTGEKKEETFTLFFVVLS